MTSEEFHSDSFQQFALKQVKSIYFFLGFFWIISIGAFTSYQVGHITPLIIVVPAIFGRIVYLLRRNYRFYKLGSEYTKRLKDAVILQDIHFSSETKNVFFQKHPKYFQVNKADIVIGKNSILFLAKRDGWNYSSYFHPVEMYKTNPLFRIHNAKILGSEEVYIGRSVYLKMKIKDEYYSKPIYIRFKTNSKEIYNFLKYSSLKTQTS